MGLEFTALTGDIGLEVEGLDLSSPIAARDKEALNEAWLRAGILLFRGIGTSPERQLALSRCFGELAVHPLEDIRVEGHPELIWLSNVGKRSQPIYKYDGVETVGRIPWHTDMVYVPAPGRGALLRMIQMPAQGGQTGWLDTAAAYDALSPEMKQKVEKLEARFEFILDPCEMRFGRPDEAEQVASGELYFPEFPEVAHPLVWTHPISGRRAINVSPLHLRSALNLPEEEGDSILEALVKHTTEGAFSYFHPWEPNDMILWDNWRTMHCTTGHPPELPRMVHRTTISVTHEFGRLI